VTPRETLRSLVLLVLGWATLLSLATGEAGAQTPLKTEFVVGGLDQPVYAVAAPGDESRLYVVEQPGRIRVVDLSVSPALVRPVPFLDITDRVVDAGNEQGLLGLAFHPDFQVNGLFFLNYTGSGGATRVARFDRRGADPERADPSSEAVLLTITQPQPNHNAGWLAFSPLDGFLYIATGDGGGAGDVGSGHTAGIGNSQDLTSNLLGKMLRIDVDATTGPGGLYGVPASNPFVGSASDDEIWSYGLRNPWRNAFDRETGDLYIADVGQNLWEEVDFQPASSAGGENWGWRCREGAHPYSGGGSCASETFVDPIYEYAHGGSPFRCSLTGGEVYRGCAVPDLRGTYFLADYCSRQIWSLRMANGVATAIFDRTAELSPPGGGSFNSITSFGLDARGEVYIVVSDGDLYRVVPDGVESACAPSEPAVPALPGWSVGVMGLLIVSFGAVSLRAVGRRHR
jgi:glucose/arabinose dehydrogenase